MYLNATFTNSITDALYAILIFFCFIYSVFHHYKENKSFTLEVVLYFFTLFAITVLGSYVHYTNSGGSNLAPGWIAISLLIIMANYFISHIIKTPEIFRILILFSSVFFSFLFLVTVKFIFLAISVMALYLIASYYSKSLLRAGFLMVVIANIVWITIRFLENKILGHTIAEEYRYDNDLYHFLLMGATIMIYKGIRQLK